jgi:hypothetical protein
MRPVAVVMIDIDTEHVLELSPVDYLYPVVAGAPEGADPPIGERVRQTTLSGLGDSGIGISRRPMIEP